MHKDNQRAITTRIIAVEISLFDGTSLHGRLHIPLQGRVTDTLNDAREFLPIECRGGGLVALAKRAIKQISLPAAEAAAYTGTDPYSILGVREDTPPAELKRAYHRLCELNHPDRITGYGLGADHAQLAAQNIARFNNAYTTIMKARGPAI